MRLEPLWTFKRLVRMERVKRRTLRCAALRGTGSDGKCWIRIVSHVTVMAAQAAQAAHSMWAAAVFGLCSATLLAALALQIGDGGSSMSTSMV